MDKNMEAYINQIVTKLDCNDEEKKEIRDEIADHLFMLKKEYLEQGYTEDEAIQHALKSFGDIKKIQTGYNSSLSPYAKLLKLSSWFLFSIFSLIVLWRLIIERVLFILVNYKNGISFHYNWYFSSPTPNYFDLQTWKANANIMPFRNILQYIVDRDHYNLNIIIDNLLGNILIFVPLGFFLPLLFKKYKKFSKVCLSSILISFFLEFLQIALHIGQFDIDDIILNTIGAVIGYFAISILIKIAILAKKLASKRILNE
ncbi:VanZ family protein [Niallia sp. 03133]|uniref:VanZ family protein n=1 Tax=Niallia sp. 03133 TaxID=3458060 RepID=UPI0040450C8F